ncbi:MAG: hypothetical protein HS115_01610 [Spirochaetales bacterium]|nr:hypothetical protein [Spirochaetales bacterium]
MRALFVLGLICSCASRLPFSPTVPYDQLQGFELLAEGSNFRQTLRVQNQSAQKPAFRMNARFQSAAGSCSFDAKIEKEAAEELQQILFALRICEGNSLEALQDEVTEQITFFERRGQRPVHKQYHVQAEGKYQFLCKGMEDLYDFFKLQMKPSNCSETIVGKFFETGRKKGRRKGAPEDGKTIKAN